MLHQHHQWDRQERHNHHQFETVDEGDGFGLHGYHLRERGASAERREVKLMRVVAYDLTIGRGMFHERGLRDGCVAHQEIFEYERPLCARSGQSEFARRDVARLQNANRI